MPTIAEMRAALGPLADGKSDDEIAALRDRFMAFADAVLTIVLQRRQASPSGMATSRASGARL